MSFRARAIYVIVTTLFLGAFAIPLVGLAQKGGLEEFLSRVNERLEALQSLSASFEQTRELVLVGQKIEAGGKLYLSKPRKMLLDYAKPEHQKLLVNDSIVTIYLPSLKQAQKFDVGERREANNLFAFWEPLGKLQEEFTISQVRQKGTRLRYLELVPRDEKAWTGLKRLMLGIDPDLLLPRFIEVEETGGDKVKMVLSDIKVNPKLDDKLFELQLGADIEVIDYSE